MQREEMQFGDPVAQKTTLSPIQRQLTINITRNILPNVCIKISHNDITISSNVEF